MVLVDNSSGLTLQQSVNQSSAEFSRTTPVWESKYYSLFTRCDTKSVDSRNKHQIGIISRLEQLDQKTLTGTMGKKLSKFAHRMIDYVRIYVWLLWLQAIG